MKENYRIALLAGRSDIRTGEGYKIYRSRGIWYSHKTPKPGYTVYTVHAPSDGPELIIFAEKLNGLVCLTEKTTGRAINVGRFRTYREALETVCQFGDRIFEKIQSMPKLPE